MPESINHSSNDHSGVIKRHIAQSDGLNEAVSLAMTNDALSIYKIEIGLYSYANDDRQKQGEIALFIASSEGLGKATKVALGLVSVPGFPCSKEVVDAAPVLLNYEVDSIKSAIQGVDGVTNEDNVTAVTGMICDYQGDGTWQVDGKILDQDEITMLIIKSLCNKSPFELTHAMGHITNEANDEHRISQ